MEQVIRHQRNSVKKDLFSSRFALIDLLRGVCMFLVIFDHIMWNFAYFFPKWAYTLGDNTSVLYHLGALANDYWYWPLREAVRFFALGAFVLLSGVSVAFSKNNQKRCLKMILLAFGLSICTNILNGFWPMGCIINYNIISVIASCVLIYCFIEHKTYRSVLATILLLFIFQYSVLPFLHDRLKDTSTILIPFWFPDNITVNGSFYMQADYMSLFPFILFFFAGVIISIFYYFPRIKKHEFGNHYSWEKPLCFLGRHSLIFYLLHQIVFQAIFMLVGISFGLPI